LRSSASSSQTLYIVAGDLLVLPAFVEGNYAEIAPAAQGESLKNAPLVIARRPKADEAIP
jgi:hypothetical protein